MSFPKYPKYKDSGVEWLGQVPGHWPVVPLKHACRIVGGTTPRSDEEGFWDGDVPWITPADMDNERPFLISSTRRRITQAGLDSCGLEVVPAGSIFLSTRAPIGSVVIAEVPMCSNQGCKGLIPNQNCHGRFLAYLLRISSGELNIRGKGTTFLELSADVLGAFVIPLPSLNEQFAIVAFLDRETAKTDALVAEQRRLMELLKEKRQAVISHAVTKGLNPHAPMKPSGIDWLGDVPKHWIEFPLRAIFELRHGYAFDGEKFSDSGEYILMTPGNFRESGGFRPKEPEKYYVGKDIPRGFMLQAGQMLVAMTEQTAGLLGSALFVPSNGTYLHNQRLGLVHKLCRDKIDEMFLFHLFNSDRLRAAISVSATGSKVRHTSPQKILSVKVFLPPVSEQQLIVHFIDAETSKLQILEAEAQRAIDLLQERRTALISAAVTGQIDVRGLSAKGEAA